jgi:hypothetical protein
MPVLNCSYTWARPRNEACISPEEGLGPWVR